MRYYADFFNVVKTAIDELDPTEAVSIQKCQDIMEKPEIENQLAYITSNFVHLKFAIIKLEEKGLSLHESTKVIDDLEDNLPFGSVGAKIKLKLNDVIEKNKGFQILNAIKGIIDGKEGLRIDQPLSPAEIAHFKYAPITTSDVERSFSMYKTLLADNRQSFLFENLRQTFVIRCNAE